MNLARLELRVQVGLVQQLEERLEIMDLVDKVVKDLMALEGKAIQEVKELLVLALQGAAVEAAVLEGRAQTCHMAGDMMEGMVVMEMLLILMVVRMHMVVVEVMVETVQVLQEIEGKLAIMGMMVLMVLMVIALLELLGIILLASKEVLEVKVPMDLQDNLELLAIMVCQATMAKIVLL